MKNQGYDDETAYNMTIHSIGDISEIIENIFEKPVKLKQQMKGKDFSKKEDIYNFIVYSLKSWKYYFKNPYFRTRENPLINKRYFDKIL